MKLTRFTDYSLRVLIHLGVHPDRRCSIPEIAAAYGISEHHLVKVVQTLGQLGYVRTVRGRGGGIQLARPPGDLRIGDVVRSTEGCQSLVECKDCIIAPSCRLGGIFREAMMAFFRVLDGYTLLDLLGPDAGMRRLLAPRESSPAGPVEDFGP